MAQRMRFNCASSASDVAPGLIRIAAGATREMTENVPASADSAQRKFFRVTDNITEEAWYWAAVGSIGLSAALKMANRNDWSIFVGQWPPTFILFGLYHRLIHPSTKP
jgi:hypothetical protein